MPNGLVNLTYSLTGTQLLCDYISNFDDQDFTLDRRHLGFLKIQLTDGNFTDSIRFVEP